MAKNDLALSPIHYASVSGGKDSFYMLNLLLHNPDKYPLDIVVHFELEIDWPWVTNVIDFMQDRCAQAGIKFVRIKPRKSFQYLYDKYGMPSYAIRWCNHEYKLDADKQLTAWIKSQNCRPIAYIGLCADEAKRHKYKVGEEDWKLQKVCYPLAEEGIKESQILEWAKSVSIFNEWYKHFDRQGCMFCPLMSMKEKAYLYKYYPAEYERYITLIRNHEERFHRYYFNEPLEKHRQRVETKWLEKLNHEE